jgi:hypothetical protein
MKTFRSPSGSGLRHYRDEGSNTPRHPCRCSLCSEASIKLMGIPAATNRKRMSSHWSRQEVSLLKLLVGRRGVPFSSKETTTGGGMNTKYNLESELGIRAISKRLGCKKMSAKVCGTNRVTLPQHFEGLMFAQARKDTDVRYNTGNLLG